MCPGHNSSRDRTPEHDDEVAAVPDEGGVDTGDAGVRGRPVRDVAVEVLSGVHETER